jgi:hypothetical protein
MKLHFKILYVANLNYSIQPKQSGLVYLHFICIIIAMKQSQVHFSFKFSQLRACSSASILQIRNKTKLQC